MSATEATREMAKIGSKFPSPIPHQGEFRIRLPRVSKNEPAKIARDSFAARAAQMESFQGRATKYQKSCKQDEHQRNADGNARCRLLPKGHDRKPNRAATDENENSGARKIQDQRRNENEKTESRRDPARSPTPKIILRGREQDDGGDAKKIARLIAIRERAEVALVMPERESSRFQIKQNRNRGEQNNAARQRCAPVTAHRAFRIPARRRSRTSSRPRPN